MTNHGYPPISGLAATLAVGSCSHLPLKQVLSLTGLRSLFTNSSQILAAAEGTPFEKALALAGRGRHLPHDEPRPVPTVFGGPESGQQSFQEAATLLPALGTKS